MTSLICIVIAIPRIKGVCSWYCHWYCSCHWHWCTSISSHTHQMQMMHATVTGHWSHWLWCSINQNQKRILAHTRYKQCNGHGHWGLMVIVPVHQSLHWNDLNKSERYAGFNSDKYAITRWSPPSGVSGPMPWEDSNCFALLTKLFLLMSLWWLKGDK